MKEKRKRKKKKETKEQGNKEDERYSKRVKGK